MLNRQTSAGLLKPLVIVALAELTFMVATRLSLHFFADSPLGVELFRTALRCATALLVWRLLKPLLLSREPQPSALRRPALLGAMLLFMTVPLLLERPAVPLATSLLFAVTSLPVGIKEEFLFRGILQNLLQKRFGFRVGLLASSLLFTAWHVGVVEDSLSSYANIFLSGLVLGLVYARSGSMLAVVVLHTAFDALFALPALLPLTLTSAWELPLSLCALFVLSHAPALRCVTSLGVPVSSPATPVAGR